MKKRIYKFIWVNSLRFVWLEYLMNDFSKPNKGVLKKITTLVLSSLNSISSKKNS